MKKSFLLSTVSAVSLIVLASCGEASVSREQAKGRADNIATKEAASDFV